MPLIIEDGTGKQDSQSYASAADARAFALLRGIALAPIADPDPVEAQLMAAMDYIEAQEPRMKGRRSNANVPTYSQALSWPRRDVCVYGDTLPDDVIPTAIRHAQMQLVIAQFNGAVLMPIIDPNATQIKREKVDVLETEYFSPKDLGASFGSRPTFPAVDSLLQIYMRPGGSSAMAYKA